MPINSDGVQTGTDASIRAGIGSTIPSGLARVGAGGISESIQLVDPSASAVGAIIEVQGNLTVQSNEKIVSNAATITGDSTATIQVANPFAVTAGGHLTLEGTTDGESWATPIIHTTGWNTGWNASTPRFAGVNVVNGEVTVTGRVLIESGGGFGFQTHQNWSQSQLTNNTRGEVGCNIDELYVKNPNANAPDSVRPVFSYRPPAAPGSYRTTGNTFNSLTLESTDFIDVSGGAAAAGNMIPDEIIFNDARIVGDRNVYGANGIGTFFPLVDLSVNDESSQDFLAAANTPFATNYYLYVFENVIPAPGEDTIRISQRTNAINNNYWRAVAGRTLDFSATNAAVLIPEIGGTRQTTWPDGTTYIVTDLTSTRGTGDTRTFDLASDDLVSEAVTVNTPLNIRIGLFGASFAGAVGATGNHTPYLFRENGFYIYSGSGSLERRASICNFALDQSENVRINTDHVAALGFQNLRTQGTALAQITAPGAVDLATSTGDQVRAGADFFMGINSFTSNGPSPVSIDDLVAATKAREDLIFYSEGNETYTTDLDTANRWTNTLIPTTSNATEFNIGAANINFTNTSLQKTVTGPNERYDTLIGTGNITVTGTNRGVNGYLNNEGKMILRDFNSITTNGMRNVTLGNGDIDIINGNTWSADIPGQPGVFLNLWTDTDYSNARVNPSRITVNAANFTTDQSRDLTQWTTGWGNAGHVEIESAGTITFLVTENDVNSGAIVAGPSGNVTLEIFTPDNVINMDFSAATEDGTFIISRVGTNAVIHSGVLTAGAVTTRNVTFANTLDGAENYQVKMYGAFFTDFISQELSYGTAQEPQTFTPTANPLAVTTGTPTDGVVLTTTFDAGTGNLSIVTDIDQIGNTWFRSRQMNRDFLQVKNSNGYSAWANATGNSIDGNTNGGVSFITNGDNHPLLMIDSSGTANLGVQGVSYSLDGGTTLPTLASNVNTFRASFVTPLVLNLVGGGEITVTVENVDLDRFDPREIGPQIDASLTGRLVLSIARVINWFSRGASSVIPAAEDFDRDTEGTNNI